MSIDFILSISLAVPLGMIFRVKDHTTLSKWGAFKNTSVHVWVLRL